MLSKQNRLKKKKDFETVFKEGKGFKEDFLFLKLRKNNLKTSRFGFVVSKNFSKKAILRNKIKRKLRELVRLKCSALLKISSPKANKLKKTKKGRYLSTSRPGMDVVLVALPGLETKDFWEIEEIIDKLFKKIRIIKNKRC